MGLKVKSPKLEYGSQKDILSICQTMHCFSDLVFALSPSIAKFEKKERNKSQVHFEAGLKESTASLSTTQ
jgi:hypothetical protein